MNDTTDRSALIAMSGGVDSSVAALKTLQDGFRCEGTTMRLYHWDGRYRKKVRTCCSDRDMNDASEVAVHLDIPYSVTDYEADFRDAVIDKFVRIYEQGGTPNPCIDCNRVLKFEKLLELAHSKGLYYIVTGHYARIEYSEERDRFLLKKAIDSTKDQSYVLYMLTQEQLAHTLFPLGSLTKSEVRKIAAAEGFVNSDKSDSQDICFIPDGDYVGFMERYTGKSYPEGDFIDTDGNVIGRHKGAVHYTIGQRKGLGVAFGEPRYVCAKSMEDNTVTLSSENKVYKNALIADELNFISIEKLDKPMKISAKTRYRQKEAPATIYPESPDKVRVVFDEPQRAITPGQAVVFYDGDIVVGGGNIVTAV